MLDDLSDELFDMVITDCGGKSLTVCVPRVAKRWTAAAARALASLRHLDARRTPMRPWPVELASNRIKPCGALYAKEIQERLDEGARLRGDDISKHIFKTRAQLLAEPGGEAKVQRKDKQTENDMRFYNPPEFRPDAFQWSTYFVPEPLRLVRLSSGELRKATQADYETGIEQRFTRVDEGDSLETLARNLRLMVSKTARLERLTIDADLWDHPAVTDFGGWGAITHHLLNLSFLPTPIAAQLKELTVYGRMCSQTAQYLAAACPNLEKLAYDTYIDGEQDDGDGMGWGGVEGEHVGWNLGEIDGLAALVALKLKCSKLTTIPLISMNGPRPRTKSTGLTNQTVNRVFAVIRDWSTLQKVLIHSLPMHKQVLANTMNVASQYEQGLRGAFLGKLSVEFGTCYPEDQFTLYDQYKAKWPTLVMDSYNDENEHLVDQPQVSVRLHQLRTDG